MKEIRILIGGMGNAARPMVDLLTSERERMENVYGLHFRIVGAVDSRGGVIAPNGISSVTLSEAKNRGTLADIPGLGIQGLTALEMIEQCSADVYLDGLPPYMPTGEPGTSNIRRALERGMHVVTANKAPLALHWKELFSLAAQQGLQIRYGTAASAGLPTLEMGKLLGRCGELLEFGGIFNASCMYVFDAMGQGQSFDMAVQGAKAGGFLEPDPSMDLDGWDTAMKTVIQANTYWDQAYTLADVAIQGICGLTQADMIDAKSRGEVWCMVGRAVQNPDGSLKLTAGPERLPADHPLARAHWSDKVLWMQTRTQGGQVHHCIGASASSTPGNMYLDLVTIARELNEYLFRNAEIGGGALFLFRIGAAVLEFFWGGKEV